MGLLSCKIITEIVVYDVCRHYSFLRIFPRSTFLVDGSTFLVDGSTFLVDGSTLLEKNC